MAYPEVIPISYEPDYHTDTIGRWEGKPRQVVRRAPHLRSARGVASIDDLEATGAADDRHRESVDRADRLVRTWLAELPGVEFGDIAIRPFRVEADGVLFGLVLEEHDGTQWAELYPEMSRGTVRTTRESAGQRAAMTRAIRMRVPRKEAMRQP